MGFNELSPTGGAKIYSSGSGADEKTVRMIAEGAAKEAVQTKNKLFLSQPVPPYIIGDTWITPDGELFVCQVDKATGAYSLGDFTVKLRYSDDTVAKEKRRVFVDTPTPPYDVGDLWLTNGMIYRCFSGREEGSFFAGDFGVAADYTDDSYAKDVEVVMQENLSELYKSNEEISQKVQSTIVTLNNDYLTAEQIEAINEENKAQFSIVEQYMTEQSQLNNRFEFSITSIVEDGVAKVKNTLVTIDEGGIGIAKTDDPYSSKFTNEGTYFYASGEEKAKFTAEGTQINGSLSVDGRFYQGNLLFEDAYENGKNVTNMFWIGGY